jgi:hypothetical protein
MMTKIANKPLYLTIFLLSLLACHTEKNSQSEEINASAYAKIDDLANRYLELNRFSGTILVARDHRIQYHQSFGLADYENDIPFSSKSAFKIGELTRLVTSDLLKRLEADKKIHATDKIAEYLSETNSEMTVDDLINLPTGFDYHMAGRLIEEVTNKSYQENIKEYGTSLGLENTYYIKEDPFKVIGYQYHNYRGNGLELEESPTYKLEEAFSDKGLKSTGHDLVKILESYDMPISRHGYLADDGFSYSLIHDIENKKTIVVLSNRRHPVANEISSSIKAILDGKDYRLPLLRVPFHIDSTIVKDFRGHYSLNENVRFEVFESDDSLFVRMGPNEIHLVPQSSNQFYMKEMDASMRFLRDSTDWVDRVLLLNGFIDSEQIAYREK